MEEVKQRPFCGGSLCRETDRRYQCVSCKLYLCGGCLKNYNELAYCPDCFITIMIELQANRINITILNKEERKEVKL